MKYERDPGLGLMTRVVHRLVYHLRYFQSETVCIVEPTATASFSRAFAQHLVSCTRSLGLNNESSDVVYECAVKILFVSHGKLVLQFVFSSQFCGLLRKLAFRELLDRYIMIEPATHNDKLLSKRDTPSRYFTSNANITCSEGGVDVAMSGVDDDVIQLRILSHMAQDQLGATPFRSHACETHLVA